VNKVRFRYSKTGKSKYISHLDLVATMQRALLRTGIKLKYSEGFNPHPYISVALPLPVGYSSLCELMDVGVLDDILPEAAKFLLPDGIVIHEAYKPARKFGEIAWVDICGSMYYDRKPCCDIINKLMSCFTGESIIISKKTKSGFKELDIAPFIKDINFSINDGIQITAKVSAQNPAVNAADLMSVFTGELIPDNIYVKRIEIYDADMIKFK